MLDQNLKNSLKDYLALLEGPVVFRCNFQNSEKGEKSRAFVEEITAMDPKLSMEEGELPLSPSFALHRPEEEPRIVFAGVPLGHEFASFVMALLHTSGRPPKISPEERERILSVNSGDFETFVSLTCHNCPHVVQSLNTMAAVNRNIRHTTIIGSEFPELAEERKVMAVPATFRNREEFLYGKAELDDILEKCGQKKTADFSHKPLFDLLVLGGGPAGATAAIYGARKGVRTGMVYTSFGGQVMDTLGIENITGRQYTEGPSFMEDVRAQLEKYRIDMMEKVTVTSIEPKEDRVEVFLKEGGSLATRELIVATGAKWREIRVPGEKTFQNKGIAYCPHCDGPLFKGKEVVVIGGGNSGVEAALDLAGLAKKVTVIEFASELKADRVLQDRLKSLSNVDVIVNGETLEIQGDDQVKALLYRDRLSGEEKKLSAQGVFILVGLVPQTDFLGTVVEKTSRGEIITDEKGKTSQPRIYGAGDCTQVPYKQIVIAMGSGATAALGAYEDLLLRGEGE